MDSSLNVRRRPDGAVDFDHYRRRASRWRRLIWRFSLRRGRVLVGEAQRAAHRLAERGVAFSAARGFRPAYGAAAVALAAAGLLTLQASAQAPGTHDGHGHLMVAPSELKWAAVPSLPPGAEMAVIEGRLSEAVPFTVRIRMPANYQVPAHWHPAIEHLTVLTGTFHMGMGDKLDRRKTRALTPGGIAIMQARTNHFGWTTEETIVQLHGVGPWGVTYVDPADDPRNR